MTEQIEKFIKVLEILKEKPHSKFDETETKQGMIFPVLQSLGWNVWDTDEVKPEYPVEGKKAAEGGKVDYCLRIKGKSEVFLEAKRPGEDLEKHQEQLLNYSFREGIKLAILSNGVSWWFYLPQTGGRWKERKFYAIDMMQQDTGEIAAKFMQLLSRNHVKSGEALQNAKFIYEQLDRQKKINETLPKAWNKIIILADSRLIDLLVDTTESICGFRPEIEDIKKMMLKFKERLFLPEIPIEQEKPKPPKPPKPPADDTQRLRMKFYEQLIEKTNTKTTLFSKISPSAVNQWICAIRSGFSFCYCILNDKSRIELGTTKKEIFDALYKHRDEIEKEIGFSLEWHRNDNRKYSLIKKPFDSGGLNNQDSWFRIQEEMIDAMLKIEKAIRPRLESID